MLDGAELSVFIAIAETGSFSLAADRLGIAQSVASKRLRRLEDQISARLIDRGARSEVRLTRVGRIFLEEAKATLAQLVIAERKARNLGRGSSGPLRIGFVFSAAMNGTLTKILDALRVSLPELSAEPRLMETPEQLVALEKGQLDIGFLRPRPSYPASCRSWSVHRERLIVGLADAHALAARETIHVCDLAEERFIVPQFHEHVGLIDHIRLLAATGGFGMPDLVRTGEFVTAACLAAAGQGVVLAPASLANLGMHGLTFRMVEDYHEQVEIVLVGHEDAPARGLSVVLNAVGLTEG